MSKVRANPKFSMQKSNGTPAEGWKINFYIAGTSTRKDTYTDNTEGSANTNPVILDARGEADIWAAGTYKVIVTDENDVQIWSVDNWGEGEDQTQTGNYNLVLNGSFETDATSSGEPDDWTLVDYADAGSGAGVHSLDATDQFHGLNSLKFVSVGDGGGHATSAYFEVQEAKPINIDWAIKSSVVDVRNVVDILWATSAKTAISTTNVYDDSATNPTSWTAKNGVGTPPSTARYAQIRVYGCHSSDSTSGSTWYDDVQVTDNVARKHTTNTFTGVNTFTATQKWSKGADLGDSDVDGSNILTLGTDGNYFDYTGTDQIDEIATFGIGTVIKIHFDAICQLTHDATDFFLPGAANITTAAGDEAEFLEYASGDCRCLNFSPAAVAPMSDFEEGSWTPTLQDTSLSDGESQTYNVQEGAYTKIGNRVFISGRLKVNSLGSLTAGDVAHIAGLPYSGGGTATISGTISSGFGSSLAITAGTTVTGNIQSGNAYIRLTNWDDVAGASQLLISEFSVGGDLGFEGQYTV